MNCLEFRQLALADPYDPELEPHAESCEKCTQFRREILEMDSDIEKALAIEVPEGLAARVMLNQSLEEKRRSSGWFGYGMAASFAAALVAGAVYLNQDQESPTPTVAANEPAVIENSAPMVKPEMTKAEMEKKAMMQMAEHLNVGTDSIDPFLAHAHHQAYEFYGSDHHPISDDALEQLMNKFELTASIDNVVYAAICPLEGESAAHLVIRDGSDQYTVMLLPDRSPGKMYTVDDTLWRGYVSPHPAGALAVLAEVKDTNAMNRLREVADKMQSAIYFTADL